MQRYHAANGTSSVNNNAVGGGSGRDSARADSSSLPTNFSLNARRLSQLGPYKLKCEKEPLNSRLGPPDFHPQTLNCPEETLTRDYALSGYRETVEGLEESREISLTQLLIFNKPVVVKCKEAIRKCLRAINESRAQKRKAGQVYGVPLSVSLLSKPGVFPEQRPCSEDFRKKWIETLSQHKQLHSLADHVPHGYRRKSLFEVLIKNNVPLLRATWYIKVTYLNQVRPGSSNITSGVPDKSQLSRTELWTKDVIDYLQCILDELSSTSSSLSMPHSRDRSPQMLYAGSVQHRSDPTSSVHDGEEPSLHLKWSYVVRLLQWHLAEGLLFPSLIIDWALSQLQEKESLDILELLLPIIYGVLEILVQCQTYIRALVGVAVRFIREPLPGGSYLMDNSRKAYTNSALVEMIRYLILAAPDTFVALDCFPLPPSVVSHAVNDGSYASKVFEDGVKVKDGSVEVAIGFRGKGLDAQYQSSSFNHVISSILKRADGLAKAASSGYPGHSVAKAVQALDEALVHGDVRGASKFLFEDLCDGAVDEGWISEVSPCLRLSLKWVGTVSLSFICSVFFLCEWATCDFRDFRVAPPHDVKFTGRKDFSQVYVAIRILKMKIGELQNLPQCKNDSNLGANSILKQFSWQDNLFRQASCANINDNSSKQMDAKSRNIPDIFESPGALHDIIVCWIDQHEVHKGEGKKRLQQFIVELIQFGIFYPQAYVRQLLVSGIIDGQTVDTDKRERHYQVLKQLPGSFLHDALEEEKIAERPQLLELMQIYSNERRLALRGLLSDQYESANISARKRKHLPGSVKDGSSSVSVDHCKTVQSFSRISSKNLRTDANMEELKAAIAVLLQLPISSGSIDIATDDSQGTVKRSVVSISSKMDIMEATPGCEDCRRAKRQKLSEERNSYPQARSPVPSDDEDTWWMRKGTKSAEPLKVDPSLKATKQVSKGRQKVVRKTQSLAQLAASRIEGSQGVSTSHVCDNKVICPFHRPGLEGETSKSIDGIRIPHSGDIFSIGKTLKQLRFVEKRIITVWLTTMTRQLVEENEKNAAKVGQFSRSSSTADDKNFTRWKLGEDELSVILYFMDVSNDLVSAVKLLLWLLPKVATGHNSTIHSGRSTMMVQRNVESHGCDVGEAFMLSSLQRYENILLAADLIPETLFATTNRATTVLSYSGRVSGSQALVYARYLLKKYSSLASVIEWEKSFKTACDKRLLSELYAGRSLDGESGFPLGVPAGVEDLDDFIRQKISGGRLSRVGMNMREIVQRHFDDVLHGYFGKDRKLFVAGMPKISAVEKFDAGCQTAQQIVNGLMDCFRQTGGAAQEGDPSLVSSAVSAIVGNVGPFIAKMPDFTVGNSYSNLPSAIGSLSFARRILRIHITCLSLLKEALGERQSRVFEIALATEASSALAGAFAPGKASRSQFHLSPEARDSNANTSNENLNNSAKLVLGKATKIAASVSALVIGAVTHGVASLERMVTVFRLKEGLDVIQFMRSTRSSSNGNARSFGSFKGDSPVEVYAHWFRLLVGNCRTISDGLIVELLGEPYLVALSRMQRMLPLSLVFPPAYSIFSFVIWRSFILGSHPATREDMQQLYHSLAMAIGDAIRHQPFRDVCLRESRGFYDFVAADANDAEFAAMLELNGSDMHLKSMAFVPLRARLFLNALIDCKMPSSVFTQDDGNRASGHGESKVNHIESKMKLLDRLVLVLDNLQPAKLHWQWVELRLLLNEQAVIEKLDSNDISLADAIRSSSPCPEKSAASENENNFIEIILTRLLVRPDAAPLFAEVVHLFGKSLEDSMLLQVKWFLGGPDVLFGRKTIRQRLLNIAQSKGLSTKAQLWKPWGWTNSGLDAKANRGDKKFEMTSLEEGEVIEEGTDFKKVGKGSPPSSETEGVNVIQQHVTERALVELVLPCIDQSSDESRNTFANDLIKQLNNIEQQISAVTRGLSKQAGTTPSGIEVSANKGSNHKGIKGGCPGLGRRQAGGSDPTPPSPAALRASMSLRLQLLLRLFPFICADGEPSARNMKHMLASVILRLLGNRVVHEDADLSFYLTQSSLQREMESLVEASADLSGESIFDRLLLMLHGLLSNSKPSWLRSKPTSKPNGGSSKKFSAIDREVAEGLQNDLDRMHLPDAIRWRIQAAMPALLPSVKCCVSCQPPNVPIAALASLQPSFSFPGFPSASSNPPQKNLSSVRNITGKSKPVPLPSQQDHDMEIDPWTLLEDGAGSSNATMTSSGDHANLRAASWLKGAVRVRRTDLTYIGAVDDDS